jgi:hypothetical protein
VLIVAGGNIMLARGKSLSEDCIDVVEARLLPLDIYRREFRPRPRIDPAD